MLRGLVGARSLPQLEPGVEHGEVAAVLPDPARSDEWRPRSRPAIVRRPRNTSSSPPVSSTTTASSVGTLAHGCTRSERTRPAMVAHVAPAHLADRLHGDRALVGPTGGGAGRATGVFTRARTRPVRRALRAPPRRGCFGGRGSKWNGTSSRWRAAACRRPRRSRRRCGRAGGGARTGCTRGAAAARSPRCVPSSSRGDDLERGPVDAAVGAVDELERHA